MTAVVFRRIGVRVFLNGEPVEISDAVLEAIEEREREASLVHARRTTATTTADIVTCYADTSDTSAIEAGLCVPSRRPPSRAERRARRFGR